MYVPVPSLPYTNAFFNIIHVARVTEMLYKYYTTMVDLQLFSATKDFVWVSKGFSISPCRTKLHDGNLSKQSHGIDGYDRWTLRRS
jgi:hypothetical protein